MPSLGFGAELGQVRVWSRAQDIRIYINIRVYKYMKIHVTLTMSIYQNSDMYIYTKKFIALIKTIFSIVMKILIYFSNYIL